LELVSVYNYITVTNQFYIIIHWLACHYIPYALVDELAATHAISMGGLITEYEQ